MVFGQALIIMILLTKFYDKDPGSSTVHNANCTNNFFWPNGAKACCIRSEFAE